jgi:hypothetical protein
MAYDLIETLPMLFLHEGCNMVIYKKFDKYPYATIPEYMGITL